MAAVTSVYAKAIFEIGQAKGQLDAFLQELKDFSDTCAPGTPLYAVLSGSGVNPNSRRAILEEVIRASGTSGMVGRLLELLVARGRVSDLAGIVKELGAMIERSQGIQAGTVKTAVELSQDELSVLASALSKRVGGKVKLDQVVDPSLLGGVVATVSGKTFDASLRSQLERFKNELI